MAGEAVRDVLVAAARDLSAAGIDTARLDARVLFAHVLGLGPEELLGIDRVDSIQIERFRSLVARRAAREPLAYITGCKEFYSIEFDVGPGVLVPRPETETLIDEALRRFPDRNASLRVVDVGTGSGCLIVAFLLRFPKSVGLAVDVSPEALNWARRNLARHDLERRCATELGEWNADTQFDVILANPPYLTEDEYGRTAPEVSHYEPRVALVAGCDGLAAYRALMPKIGLGLKEGGLAIIEIGAGQMSEVEKIVAANGLRLHGFAGDLSGIARCVIAGRSRWRQVRDGKKA